MGLLIIFLFVQIIVDCSGEDGQEKTLDTAFLNKKAALLQLAEKNRVPRTIVFCNKVILNSQDLYIYIIDYCYFLFWYNSQKINCRLKHAEKLKMH